MKRILSIATIAASLLAVIMFTAHPAAAATTTSRYTVVTGDYLSKIAVAMCHDAGKWPAIWHANPQIHNPNLIYPGQVLAVPCATGQATATLAPANTGWVSPLPGARCISGWGAPRVGHAHKGIDLVRPSGTPIRATHAGTVAVVRYQAGGAGWYVMLNHGTYQSVYMHLIRRSFLPVGAHVAAGQTIGYVGATGHATGPHLHFEVHRGAWHPFNPAPFLRAHGIAVVGC